MDSDGGNDRILLRLDAGGPIELEGLSESFAALARMYARYYGGSATDESPPKLFITKLETGSVWAEIAPYAVIFGQAVTAGDGIIVVAEFTRRITNALKAFADIKGAPALIPPPTPDDAADLREFIKPMTGKRGASLGISHARYTSKTAEREVIAEYTFTESELNRAAINIENSEALIHTLAIPELLPASDHKIRTEVMLFFQQASRAPGKEDGRTGDKAIIPDVSDKPLPTYFRKGVNDLKDRMVRGQPNPLINAFVVDVHVQIVDGEPKGYLVTEVHKVIPVDEV
jgi:hypothetical protein